MRTPRSASRTTSSAAPQGTASRCVAAFAVLGLAGGTSEAQQLGFSIAFGVVLDTFFVRSLLVPSIAALLGRWNWWPSRRGLPDHPSHFSVSRVLFEQPMRGR
jgi:uncharacterized membrane protein YdfJ with MMPL/SSD domain